MAPLPRPASSRRLARVLAGALLALTPGSLPAPAFASPADSAPPFLELLPHGRIEVDPAWHRDRVLQSRLVTALRGLALMPLVEQGRIGVALVDVVDPSRPRLAEVNGELMMYAASVPKIGVLYAAFQARREGRLRIDADFRRTLTDMIRVSSNQAATEAIFRVGFNYINSVLWQSGLYDPAHGGGLWVGKAYGGQRDYWHRDPLHGTSHGATAMSVARLLTLIAQERLVDPESSSQMKEILSQPGIHHKFVRGLDARPGSRIFRKSGSWHEWHGDAALVERDDAAYVAVALVKDQRGEAFLEELIVALDDCATAPDLSAALRRP